MIQEHVSRTWQEVAMLAVFGADVITPQPAMMITPRFPPGLETVTSSKTVSVTSPLGWGINLICMLTNKDEMQIDNETVLLQCAC